MGRAWKYGDDINTDVLYPGRYLDSYEPSYLASHALEDLDPEFAKNVKEGDVIAGGKYFGCGSSREQAASALKYCGVKAVIAKSFARIYYRNAINMGIPPIETPDVDKINHGDEIELDMENGIIHNRTTGEDIRFNPLPSFIMEIINDGGLVPHLKKKLGTE